MKWLTALLMGAALVLPACHTKSPRVLCATMAPLDPPRMVLVTATGPHGNPAAANCRWYGLYGGYVCALVEFVDHGVHYYDCR